MSAKGRDFTDAIVRNSISSSDSFTITYNRGKGHFTLNSRFLFSYSLKDFKKIVAMIESADDRETVAAYVNLKLKAVYNETIRALNAITVLDADDQKFKNEITDFVYRVIKLHDILAKDIEVAPLVEVVKEEPELEANENITALKKCNVVRFIPSQVNPIWENGTLNTFIGYNFEYRGMPLQVYRSDGWENRSSKCTRVYIVDPVIGLPIYQYDGMLSDLEQELEKCFLKYLATIESNKEAIVLIAKAFEALKTA